MTIEQAIEKAIEGGMKEGERWKLISANRYWVGWFDGNGDEVTISLNTYLLDPLFWQALGKALGWGRICGACHGGIQQIVWEHRATDGKTERYACGHDTTGCPDIQDEWRYHWHRFIDHLAEGGTIEDFFKDL